MTKLNLSGRICAVLLLLAATAIASPAQTFTTLASFDVSNGANPAFPSLVQGFDGDLYGTTPTGAGKGGGTVFKITTAGALTTLHKFCAPSCVDARTPKGGVALGTDGNLYGTAEFRDSSGGGTTFQMTPTGTLTNYSLGVFGSRPVGALIQAAGDFYGTASVDGAHAGGAVFKVSSEGRAGPGVYPCGQVHG